MSNSVSRRAFLGSAVPLAALAAGRKPNIVLFYADDLDADELGCTSGSKNFPSPTGTGKRGYDDPRMLTPHIDGIAREGATFTRFYITSPVCTPSRYSLLTGRYASRSPGLLKNQPPGGPSLITWNTPIVAEENSLAKELKRNAYTTGIVGKWHNFHGSDRVREVEKEIPDGADPRDPALKKVLAERHRRACDALRTKYGFDYADRINIGNTELTNPAAIRGQNLEWHTEGALEFLRANHATPFFLYYALPVPHGSYHNLRKLDPLATAAGMLEQPPKSQPSRESIYERLRAAGIAERNAMATWMDDAVGAVLNAIDSYGLKRNTVVLFISDNPSRGKNSVYEGARVPAMVRWPERVKAGSQVLSLCANIDVEPTLLEAAGAKPPADLDGRSFLPQLTGAAEPRGWREQLLLEIHNSRAVVTRKWKYIANRVKPETAAVMRAEAERGKRETGWNGLNHHNYNAESDFPYYFDADQLYDLDNDIYERTNLASKPEHARALADMKERMKQALAPLPHTFGEFKE